MDRKVQGRAAARMQTRRCPDLLQMHRYHQLDLAKLNRHPKDVRAFDRWLSQAFDEIQAWLEHPAGIDESDFAFSAAVANRASQTARRLGAGDLALPLSDRRSHGETLELLGRLLAWCDGQVAVATEISLSNESGEMTLNEAADALKAHPKTVGRYIVQGVLAARDAAPPSSKHRDWRIPVSAVLEFRAKYQLHGIAKPTKPNIPHAKSFTPKLLTWGNRSA